MFAALNDDAGLAEVAGRAGRDHHVAAADDLHRVAEAAFQNEAPERRPVDVLQSRMGRSMSARKMSARARVGRRPEVDAFLLEVETPLAGAVQLFELIDDPIRLLAEPPGRANLEPMPPRPAPSRRWSSCPGRFGGRGSSRFARARASSRAGRRRSELANWRGDLRGTRRRRRACPPPFRRCPIRASWWRVRRWASAPAVGGRRRRTVRGCRHRREQIGPRPQRLRL